MGKVRGEDNPHTMKESKKIGDAGEQLIREYYSKMDGTIDAHIVKNKRVQKDHGIDILVFKNIGQVTAVEVKTDTYKTGNMYIETTSCVETKSLGCLVKTRSDILFYYFVGFDRGYEITDMDKFQSWVDIEVEKAKRGDPNAMFKKCKSGVPNQRYDGTIYHSDGYTVKLWYVEKCLKAMGILNIHNEVSKGLKYQLPREIIEKANE